MKICEEKRMEKIFIQDMLSIHPGQTLKMESLKLKHGRVGMKLF